jgi:hypothetical protein
MSTGQLGFGEPDEEYLNSPVQQQILAMLREIVTNYPIDLAYFDGLYQGMDQQRRSRHCQYCHAA